jgi:hypothetical protein
MNLFIKIIFFLNQIIIETDTHKIDWIKNIYYAKLHILEIFKKNKLNLYKMQKKRYI